MLRLSWLYVQKCTQKTSLCVPLLSVVKVAIVYKHNPQLKQA